MKDDIVIEVREMEKQEAEVVAQCVGGLIDITDIVPQPRVGWKRSGNVLVRNLPDLTPRQVRQGLILSGIDLTMIDAALNSLPEPTRSLALTEWEYSNSFERNRPLVLNVATMLGWTEDQLDALWTFAGSLK